MKTAIQIFLKQTLRSTNRLILQLVLLCAAVAFFVVSLNLCVNSMRNLQTVENSYTTIATMEIRGYVNKAGELVSSGAEDCVGYHCLSVEDYDLSFLLELEGVKSIDFRTRVGAYIPENIEVEQQNDGAVQLCCSDILRFTLNTEQPLEIPLQGDKAWTHVDLPIQILWHENQQLVYPESTDFCLSVPRFSNESIVQLQEGIRRLNGNDRTDVLILYPNVEYVVAELMLGSFWMRDPDTGTYLWTSGNPHSVTFDKLSLGLSGISYYFYPNTLYYSAVGLLTQSAPNQTYLSLRRYEDTKNDPVWAEYTQAVEYEGHSFAVTLTEDISLIPAWHAGSMYLYDGRMITEAEYASGARVCMVSSRMAELQGWQVGDSLDMHLYACDTFFDTALIDDETQLPPMLNANYYQNCGGFFQEDTYEIVGIFGQTSLGDIGDTAEEVFYNPWNSIYIPANAAPNAPEGPIQPSLITIELKNGSIEEFKAAVEEMGLTDQTPGEYEIKFSYFDQGYSKIADSLQEMNRNAKLLLGLSAVLLTVTMILTAFLFSRQHRHSAGILRLLGGSRGQAFAAILACAAAVAAAGGILGTILGGTLTQSVGASILGDTAESAAVALHTGASPALTAVSGVGCVVLFLLLTAVFTATYIGKEPRQLLPENRE